MSDNFPHMNFEDQNLLHSYLYNAAQDMDQFNAFVNDYGVLSE